MKDVIIACDFANQEQLFEFLKPFEGLNPYLKLGMEIVYKEGPQLVKKVHALPTGYTGELVELTAYVEPNAVTDLTATNTPITSRIKIIKTDAVTGDVLPGAVFSVTDDAGYTVATITTGADGTASTGWLSYGYYTISEGGVLRATVYWSGGGTDILEKQIILSE